MPHLRQRRSRDESAVMAGLSVDKRHGVRKSFGASPRLLAVLAILVVTALTRLMTFGNPAAHIDDQFYLYVGHSILAGDIPYVDIWDRKPIGIFLIYAACAALGGNGVVQYQLVAAIFVFATALTIYGFGRLIAPEKGALLAALIYPIMIAQMGGDAGQAPVFHNLFMALPALLIFKATTGQDPPSLWSGGLAMALVGIALTIKQTTVFEGIFFGLWFVIAGYIRDRRLDRAARVALLLAAVAALPTALSYLVYFQLGHLDAMWQATVISVLRKLPVTLEDRFSAVPYLVRITAVPLLIAIFSIYKMVGHSGWKAAPTFVTLWLIAAAIGFFAIPNFFFHYALPLAVPMSIAMAAAFGLRPLGKLLFVGVVIAEIVTLIRPPFFMSPYRDDYPRLLAAVRKELGSGCLYIYYGSPQLYTDTGACRVTSFVFPDHLETMVESEALPVAPEAEMNRFFRQNPPQVVVTGERQFLERNRTSEAVLLHYLNCQYRRGPRVQQVGWAYAEVWTLLPERVAICRRNQPQS